jgi:hypothetical protein
VALCLYAVVGLAAAGVWETKPFTEWTDKETQAVLTDSPWAGKGSLTNARAGGAVGQVPDWKVTVTWRTALPIRQAMVRQQIGQGGKTTPEQQALLTATESHYIVAVDGLPGMFAGTIQGIGGQTALEREGKAPIAPTQGMAQLFDKEGKPIEQLPARGGGAPAGRGGGARGFGSFGGDGSTATLIFGFPKSDPITAADKEVEFSTTIGAYHLKRKFRLKDMLLNGEPAL